MIFQVHVDTQELIDHVGIQPLTLTRSSTATNSYRDFRL